MKTRERYFLWVNYNDGRIGLTEYFPGTSGVPKNYVILHLREDQESIPIVNITDSKEKGIAP